MSNSISGCESRHARMGRTLLPALSSSWVYVLMSLAILGLDMLTGPFLMFPILFVVPVSLCAWFCSGRLALMLTVLLPLGRLFIAGFVERPIPLIYAGANALVRVAVLAFIAILVARIARLTKELQRQVNVLEKEIAELRSMLKPALAVGDYTPPDQMSNEEFAGRLRRRLGSLVRGSESGGFEYMCNRSPSGDYIVSLMWQSTQDEAATDRTTMSVAATAPTETLAFLRAAEKLSRHELCRKMLFA